VRALTLLVILCTATACAKPHAPEQVSMGGDRGWATLPPRNYVQTVEIRAAAGDPRIAVLGPERPWPGHPYNAQRLRSYRPIPGGPVTHELYVDSFYEENRTGGAVAWSRAQADDGTALTVVFIDRKRIECGVPNACPRRELLTVALSDALLRSRARSGLQVRIQGESGHAAVLAVGSDQITQQLAAVDRSAAQ